ncbi:MAG: hypothetical protein KDC39_04810 [Actinobacteria bacterium]|nr:hypothetical protein [Actinomycetota bacterium]
MRVALWTDVRCPWTWVTARWLVGDVMTQRDVELDWRPMSLLLAKGIDPDHAQYDKFLFTHRLLRVLLAVKDREGNDGFTRAYLEFGTRVWTDRDWNFDIAAALLAAGLNPEDAAAADDDRWDAAIELSMAEAYELIGEGIGNTPILAVLDGQQTRALYGPVLSRLPAADQSLRIWDATVTLIECNDTFAELNRATPDLPEL